MLWGAPIRCARSSAPSNDVVAEHGSLVQHAVSSPCVWPHVLKPSHVLRCSTGYAAAVPLVIKAQGKVDALVAQTYSELEDSRVDLQRVFDSHTGIAHTRWATHGVPNAINSHPQVLPTSRLQVASHGSGSPWHVAPCWCCSLANEMHS